ncbi:MAG: P-loop NTPase [Candidatus Micrarchaeota archaeon]|nr:P-loop NTPase [Candidatus Micrarchaeota archaeon]
MQKSYIVRVSSPKGGVGKSVISVNLAIALQQLGFNVLVLDLDLINPCVGLYMGMPDTNIGTLDVLKKPSTLKRAIVPHLQTGVRVLPGRISRTYTMDDWLPTAKSLRTMVSGLSVLGYDFIIVDTQPGIAYPIPLDLYSEALIVTQPHKASCISAVKLLDRYGKAKLKTTLVTNRVRKGSSELSTREIEEMTEEHIAVQLPEDMNVPKSVDEGVPVLLMNKRAPFSKSVLDLADIISSRIGRARVVAAKEESRGGRILGFFRKKG